MGILGGSQNPYKIPGVYIPRVWQSRRVPRALMLAVLVLSFSMISLGVWPIWLNSRVTKPDEFKVEKGCHGVESSLLVSIVPKSCLKPQPR